MQHQSCPVPILYGGRRDDNREEQAQGIDQHMAFAARNLLAGVIPTSPWPGSLLDALAIETPRCWMFMATRVSPDLSAHRIMDALPHAIIAPAAEIMIDWLPFRILTGAHPLLNAAHNHREDRIDNQAHIHTARLTTRRCSGDHILDILPLRVGQVTRIELVAHARSVPRPTRFLNRLLAVSNMIGCWSDYGFSDLILAA